MFISDTDKDCDPLHDRPALPSGRTPHAYKTATVHTGIKIWSWVPEGASKPGLTDWLTHSLTHCQLHFDSDYDSEGSFNTWRRTGGVEV
jgi:hypothetical protein